jgi:hypothetical protein
MIRGGGKRHGFPTDYMTPHNLPFTAIGAFLVGEMNPETMASVFLIRHLQET